MGNELAADTILSHYRIVSKIGAGGMGVVYRGRDTRLDREVAIKFLSSDLARDPHRLERFEQEARATSALNHPNILTVYDIGNHEGAPYIVAELLEGEELRVQLDAGALPLRRVIDYSRQVVAGLAAAHEKSIVHRDLKPENLFITRDGRVKILDFGLAKLTPMLDASADSEVATQMQFTNPGTVMGTVGYMSPEQVLGERVDHRSDLFSMGLILFEMLSGERAFQRATMPETMTAILKDDVPELNPANPGISPELEKIVRRCLEKKPERRFQSSSDLGFALETFSTSASHGPAQARPAATEARSRLPWASVRLRERLVWAASALLLLLAGVALAYGYFKRAAIEVHAVRSHILPPDRASFKSAGLDAGPVSVSPDGRSLAFVATSEEGKNLLWVRSLSALSAQPLTGTDGASFPFWSADSSALGFFADGKLKKVDAAGGPVFTVCDAPAGRGGSWNRDGVIIFAPDHLGSLRRVAASGGDTSEVTMLDQARGELAHRWPSFLPDGRHFLYLGAKLAFNASESDVIYVSSVDRGEAKVILRAGSNVAYAGGYLLFVRQPWLMAQPFDVTRLATTEDAFPIAEQVQSVHGSTNSVFSVSENGVLAYQAGAVESGSQLAWHGRSGKPLGALGDTARYAGQALSPDGKRVAVDLSDQTSNIDIWLIEVARGLRTRFTLDRGIDISPVWSSDGKHLAFTSNRKGHLDLYRKAASGIGNEELLLESGFEKFPQSFSSDGRFLLYYTLDNSRNKGDLWILPLTGERKPFPFSQSEFNETYCAFSPDGHWVVYESDESGRSEIYIAPFPGPGGKRQVSASGGSQPRWRRDGKEIFFLAPDGKLMAAEVIGQGESLEIVTVRALFQTRVTGPGYQYDVAVDGQRFLINTLVDQKVTTPITLVQNWTAGLKQ